MALPPDEPLIAELQPSAVVAIGELWHRRAASELRVGAQFRLLASEFRARSSPPELCAHLEQAALDEARHSELCAAVGNRYAIASALEGPSPVPPLVRFGDADERVSLLLHLVLLSCVNEGVSTFYLRDAMKHSRAVLARTALRQLLSDDVQHARIGWMHLASPAVTSADKRLVALALPTLLNLSREAWTNVPVRAEPWFVEHGCPGLDVAEQAFHDAVRELVLPGMTHVGIDVAPATRWLAPPPSPIRGRAS
jgi:hypothetical protein